MSRVTGLARLPGQILLSVHTVNFSPVDRDEIQRNTTKMVEHKLVSFAAVVALWTNAFQTKMWCSNLIKFQAISYSLFELKCNV